MMAGIGKQNPRSKSPFLLFTLILVVLFILLFLLLSLRSPNFNPFPDSNDLMIRKPSYKPETSFVASLDNFLLTHKSSALSQSPSANLDRLTSDTQFRRLLAEPYYPLNFPIRVYVYDMPTKFNFDLLWLFRKTYRDTSNLTSNGSPVHRLIEQVYICICIVNFSRSILDSILY